jgi:hypothetical protein
MHFQLLQGLTSDLPSCGLQQETVAFIESCGKFLLPDYAHNAEHQLMEQSVSTECRQV